MSVVYKSSIAAASALMLAAQPANAALIDVTIVGNAIGYDGNLFGINGPLNDDRFVARLRFDTDLGTGFQDENSGSVIGGIADGLSSPIVSSSISMNNTTFFWGGEYWAGYDRAVALPNHWLRAFSESRAGSNYATLWFDANWSDGSFDSSLSAPFSRSFVFEEYGVGNFSAFWEGQSTYVEFGRTHVFIHEASAVPEPASWAMMIGGFGLVGGALRRRRAVTA